MLRLMPFSTTLSISAPAAWADNGTLHKALPAFDQLEVSGPLDVSWQAGPL